MHHDSCGQVQGAFRVKDNQAQRPYAGLLTYFDTNVFDPEHGVTQTQEDLVLDAIASHRIRLVFDLDSFLEPLLAFRGISADTRPRAAKQLARMRKWCDFRRIVRSAESLLLQAVLSYCKLSARNECFLDEDQLDDQVRREITNWDDTLSPRSTFWQSIANDAQREREIFKDGIACLLQRIRPTGTSTPRTSTPTLKEFWDAHRHRVAEIFVENMDQGANHDLWQRCAERGIDGLLDTKCVHIAVSATVGLMYSHFYNDGRRIPKVRLGDAADLRHAISASAAEIFVTKDWKLYRRLCAVSFKDFKVVYLDAFLADL